ncbi:hypothetical protein LK994_04155 [Ferruginibacter lapsinanis]|uniref:hypothetical protein n=1 Tax=Ferruginibacter lapsinanis TaxID=563172 RepID=UPI001E4C347C|nr:hypothetical protein [Ferruginibacter lapsinanis]UEG50664.1 hypothetical protein LK994_04155 [Ferruginibacter lapsinanis]
MKDTKFYPLLAISIVLLLASFILLCILGYNFYTKSQEQKSITAIAAKHTNLLVNTTRDSLQKVYAETVNQFQHNSSLTKEDSLKLNLNTKLTDFNTLRNEIASLLKDNSSLADLSLAKQKIGELQLKVDELRNRNIDIENENKRLNAMLAEYTGNANAIVQNTKQTDNSAKAITEKNNSESSFTASDLRLTASNNNEVEVTEAEQTEKLVGTFVVKNTTTLNNAELVVVVIQPDGKVLKNAWESGSFDTNEGKKIYSRKIRFDYTKGEAKQLKFSLAADSGQKGNYTMLLYNKGKVIGRAIKTIS